MGGAGLSFLRLRLMRLQKRKSFGRLRLREFALGRGAAVVLRRQFGGALAATVDYLVIFPRTDSFCDTQQGFLRLIQLDSRVSVTSGDVRYEGKSVCECRLVHGEVAGREQRYFQVSLVTARPTPS